MKDLSHNKLCEICGAVFYKNKAHTFAYFNAAKFCSRKCSGKKWSIMAADARPKSLKDYFLSRVIPSSGIDCFEWPFAKDRDGYGFFGYQGRQHKAHRVSLIASGVLVPRGIMVCHNCDNPSCVNPSHLFLGSAMDNYEDCVSKGRHTRGERSGRAKLKDCDIIEIRNSVQKVSVLSKKYNVCVATISNVIKRKTWVHI